MVYRFWLRFWYTEANIGKYTYLAHIRPDQINLLLHGFARRILGVPKINFNAHAQVATPYLEPLTFATSYYRWLNCQLGVFTSPFRSKVDLIVSFQRSSMPQCWSFARLFLLVSELGKQCVAQTIG